MKYNRENSLLYALSVLLQDIIDIVYRYYVRNKQCCYIMMSQCIYCIAWENNMKINSHL